MTTTDREKPRRKRGEGVLSQRPNGTWLGQIDLGRDAAGRRRRRTVYGRTQREVLAKMTELRRQLTDHGDIPTADMRTDRWLTYWLEEIAAKRVKPSTLRSYRSAVDLYLTPSLGKKPLSRLSPANIRDMHRYVVDAGCSTTTAHNAHRILAAALNDAVREGRVGRNAAALVRAPAKAVSTRRGLSWDEARGVLTAAADDDRTAARWLAAFLLGARQGELLGLRWDYLDLDAGSIDLAWSLQRVGYTHGCDPACEGTVRACPAKQLPIPAGIEHRQLYGNLCLLRPKSRTSQRVIPLPRPLWAALQLRRDQADAERPGYTVDHRLVWCRPDGQPIHPHADWLGWQAMLAAAKIDRPVTLHEARHSTATWLLEAAIPETVIRDLLGHSDVLTQRSYQHVSQQVGRAALDGIAGRLALD